MSNFTDFHITPLDRRTFLRLSTGLISSFSPAPDVSAAVTRGTSPKRLEIPFIIANQMTLLLTSLYGHNIVEIPDLNELAQKNVRDNLRIRILNQFDTDTIEKELRDSLQRRLFLMKTMQKTRQDWAYCPEIL